MKTEISRGVGARILRQGPRNTAYSLNLARSPADVRAAQALRFQVFNLELGEGLEKSYETGLDADPFDDICDHLLVKEIATGAVVGSYRLQTGLRAAECRGYYSAQEFDFKPYERIRFELVELGRACVHQAHRNLTVLGLLWKGISDYCDLRSCRYLVGCSSLTSQDPLVGATAYSMLCRRYLAEVEFQTRPNSGYECSLSELAPDKVKIPKLLNAYLSIGAKICGPPAIDRGFKTIDFLTLLDLGKLRNESFRLVDII